MRVCVWAAGAGGGGVVRGGGIPLYKQQFAQEQ